MIRRLVIATAATLFGCSACGFKGPLYLPQQNGAVVTHPPTETAVAAPAAKPAAAPHKPAHKTSGGRAAPP
jgi:predicted small lipoprotein YifL